MALLSHSKDLVTTLYLSLLLTASLVSASTFTTHYTLRTEPITRVSGANIRATFEILWSGVLTIFHLRLESAAPIVSEQQRRKDQG
jgi:hypothetical protein